MGDKTFVTPAGLSGEPPTQKEGTMFKKSIPWTTLMLVAFATLVTSGGCGQDGNAVPTQEEAKTEEGGVRILFLHHSTGGVIWDGGVAQWFDEYNAAHGTNYQIEERAYPDDPYPWANYPYDYWNLWVDHAGERPYEKQDTLEMLTQDHDVVVWKHCFPVSEVEADTGAPDVASQVKTIENYQVQYEALKEKMRQFPDTTFIVWTGAALVAGATDEASAGRAREFFEWVKSTWDEPGDNLYLWDFRQLETEGELYLLDKAGQKTRKPKKNEKKNNTYDLFLRKIHKCIFPTTKYMV